MNNARPIQESSASILREIEELQAIQKTHPSSSGAWMQASEMLGYLFAEMARIERLEKASPQAALEPGDFEVEHPPV